MDKPIKVLNQWLTCQKEEEEYLKRTKEELSKVQNDIKTVEEHISKH